MTIFKFEDLIEKDPADNSHEVKKASQRNSMQSSRSATHSYQKEPINHKALAEAEEFYRQVYADKKRIDLLKKRADQLVEKAKLHIVEIVGYQDHKTDEYDLEQIERQGSVDWKRLEDTFPGIRVNPFRKPCTVYWRLTLKEKKNDQSNN